MSNNQAADLKHWQTSQAENTLEALKIIMVVPSHGALAAILFEVPSYQVYIAIK